MKTLKNKIAAATIAIIFILSMATSATLISKVSAATTTNLPTYAFLEVNPNPCGIGQTVTLDMFLAVPLLDSELAKFTVAVTDPSGTKTTLGPFTSDTTGGTYTLYTPAKTGNYTFELTYLGQNLTVPGYTGDYEEPSTSTPVTLSVTTTPASTVPNTPLPTSWWQTPVNAENVQNWASLTGPWLGLGGTPFADTGLYNMSGDYNPYTSAPTTAHILWTKVWMAGGVAGGELGNSEQYSDYWTTCQYTPRYAPVIIDGIEYSTWYTTTTDSSQGVVAMSLYTGQTLWVINTQNPLVFGMQVQWENPNQYGVCGPYIFTSGTLPGVNDGSSFGPFGPSVDYELNMYDALTGEYVCSIVNGTSPNWWAEDSHGDILGYLVNTTAGTQNVYPDYFGGPVKQVTTTGPSLEMWNLTDALGMVAGSNEGGLGDWGFSIGEVLPWSQGLEWQVQSIPTTLNGVPLVFMGLFGPAAFGTGAFSPYFIADNTLVLTGGTTSVGEQPCWQVEAGFNLNTGAMMWIYNRTESFFTSAPYTRITNTPTAGDGVYVELNYATLGAIAFSLQTGQEAWTSSLDVKMSDGNMPSAFDDFGLNGVVDQSNGVFYIWGFGGDVWALNMTNGHIIWTWQTSQISNAEANTPYGVWPLWAFTVGCVGGGEMFIGEGHEYDPPLFHGAQEVCLNITNGQLVWSNLAFDDAAPAIAYGIFTTINMYDGQIYAYGRGPSATTISAPQVGVTAGTPVTLTGTVMDVSAGASQEAVKANFANGLPCVSDASMSAFMEAVYEQQPMPTNIIGVPVTLTETDHNGNTYTIGTTTTNAYGSYGFNWTPQIPGNYTIVASFGGTGGYYGSCAETYLYANSPAATAAPTASPPTGLATTSTVELGIVAVIIVIIIIGVVLALLMMRKHP
jgi:hypothetical protein